MNSEYLELGPVPSDEECTGTREGTDYITPQNQEMATYRRQLERMFPDADFRAKRFPHDFGSYGEVCVVYAPGTESEELAYRVEENLPRQWDNEERRELAGLKVFDLAIAFPPANID